VVRVGDRVDDREAEAESVVVVSAAAVESLERLEETLDLLGWDRRAGVRDGEEAVPVAAPGGDLDVSARAVVADRVVDQIVVSRSSSRGSPAVGAAASVA
jgi:hypothetical protein